MNKASKAVAVAAEAKFLLDEYSVSRSPLGKHFIVTVYKYRIGHGGGCPSGVDRSKRYRYRATVNGDHVSFKEEEA